jgi:hypothetical protein
MQRLQNLNFFQVTAPTAINDNTAYTTATIDTIGYDELLIEIAFGAMDIAVAALKLTESDASNMGSPNDITGADFSVSPATLPSATDDNHFYGIHVKLGGARKRYMDLSFTAGDGAAGTYASVNAILGKAEIEPSTAALRGFTQLFTV